MSKQNFVKSIVLTATSGAMPIIVAVSHVYFLLLQREKKKVLSTMAIGNKELMRESFPKHSHMGTARMQDDEGKRGVSIYRK